MFIKKLRRVAACVMIMTSVAVFAACGDNDKDKGEDNTLVFDLSSCDYSFEEKKIGDDNSGGYIADYYMDGKDFYYTYVVYSGDAFESVELMDANEDLEYTDSSEIQAEEDDNTKEQKEEINGNSDEEMTEPDDVSDEDLLGDMEDLFGDDSKDDDSKDEDSKDEDSKDEDSKDDDSKDDVSNDDIQQENEEVPEDDKSGYEDYLPECSFRKYNMDTGEITELYKIAIDESYNKRDIVYYVDDKENKKAVTVEYAGDGSEMTVKYVVTDNKGNVVSEEELTDSFLKAGENSDEVFPEKGIVSEDGTMYVLIRKGEKTEIIKLVDGKVDGSIIVDSYLNSIAFDNNNKLIGLSMDEKSRIAYLDFEKGAMGDVIYEIEEGYFVGDIISGKANVSLFLKNSTGFYAFDAENGEKTEILQWLKCGIIGDDVVDVIPCADGKLFCVYYDEYGYKTGYLVRSIGDEKTEKKVITIASLYPDYDIQQMIVEYNNEHSDLKIEYKTYDEKENPEEAFANDIIAGEIPDILDVANIDFGNYIAKGLIEDIGPYLSKDGQINREYFVDGVLDVTAIDGKNYYLPKYFTLNGLCGRKSELEKYADGWSMQEMIDYYKSKPAGTMLLPYESNSTMAFIFLYSNMSSFVDWNTGKVTLDSEEFRKGLEFCRSFSELSEEGSSIDIRKEIEKGNLLLKPSVIMEVTDMQIDELLFDKDVIFLGYPSAEKYGMLFKNAGVSCAMSAMSENKEEAWEVIKYIMLGKDEYMPGFPVSNEEFEKLMKRESTTVKYTEEDGTVVEPKDETTGYDGFEVKITPAKDETINIIREHIKNSALVMDSNLIIRLIEEDIQEYFEGSKTLDDTIRVIQDKVSKFVNENR